MEVAGLLARVGAVGLSWPGSGWIALGWVGAGVQGGVRVALLRSPVREYPVGGWVVLFIAGVCSGMGPAGRFWVVLASFHRGVWVSEASELPWVHFSPKWMLAVGVFICGMGFLVCGEGYCFTPLLCDNLYILFLFVHFLFTICDSPWGVMWWL